MYDMPMHQGRQLPQITFREIDIPELVVLEVGDSRYFVMKLELIEKHSGKYIGMEDKRDGNQVEATFRVLSTKVVGNEPVDARSLEQKEFQSIVAKVKSGEM